MRLEIDVAEHHYNNIMALDSVSLGRVPYKGIIMYSINAIKHGKVLEQEPTNKKDLTHNLCDSCTNIGCVFQSGIVRTECAFYMSPHIEPDNCGNYVVQDSTTKNDLALIRTEGLDEEIRCTMCTNYMKSDRGCDGSCVVNKDMYKAVMDAIEKRIQPTTENNLAVDWENYKDTNGNSLDDLILEVLQNNFDCGNTYGYKVADEIIGLLPPVTPQKCNVGRWIFVEGIKGKDNVEKCSFCGSHWKKAIIYRTDTQEYLKTRLLYCPNCGNRNEVEE